MTRSIPGALALTALVAPALLALAAPAVAAEKFDRVHCLEYARGKNYPLDAVLYGTGRGQTVNLPMAICVARRGDEVIALDSGFTNQELGRSWGVEDYLDFSALLAQIDVRPEDVSLVTLSHLHFDHGGGTSAFPNAKFVVQRSELEFAAGGMPHNSLARTGFVADDVLDVVRLNWQDRVILVQGDREQLLPGLDVYETPGHTIGTMTVCLDTTKGRVCYSSDAVYLYRNIEEDIALGLALDAARSVDSFKKIRTLLRGGILIPGHEAAIFERPEDFGFRRVSERAIAIVE